jgi:hypothetical protein
VPSIHGDGRLSSHRLPEWGGQARRGFDLAPSAGRFETAFQGVISFAVFFWLVSLLPP